MILLRASFCAVLLNDAGRRGGLTRDDNVKDDNERRAVHAAGADGPDRCTTREGRGPIDESAFANMINSHCRLFWIFFKGDGYYGARI